LSWFIGKPSPSSVDHTTSSIDGSFAWVDISKGGQYSKARLTSIAYPATTVECLQFWYLASGLNESTLAIYEKYGNNYGQPIWLKNSHENEDWRFGQVGIGSSMNENYSIVFEGVKLKSQANGTLGIDDIEVKIGECSSYQYDCDFEEFTFCTWQQSKKNDIDWLLNQGETDIANNLGPGVDVSLGTQKGVYAFVESNYPIKKNEKALLVSDFIQPNINLTLSKLGLYYFMNGDNVGQLNIYLNDTQNDIVLLKSLTGEKTNGWKKIDLNFRNEIEFRLVLEVVVSKF
jgi:hypothetical protein